MKKSILALATVLFASFVFFSCSDDDKDRGKDIDNVLDLPYSSLSVADQKKKLNLDGENLTKELEGITTEKSTLLLTSLENLSDGLFDVIGGGNDDVDVTPHVKSTSGIIKLAEYNGVYTWDSKLEQWEKSEEKADKLILNLPATKEATKNNGKIEIEAKASSIDIDGYEIPSDVVAKFYVDNNEVGHLTAKASDISEASFFKTANVDLALGSYKLVANVEKESSKNNVDVKLVKGDKTVLDAVADLAASVTQENIDKEDFNVGDGNALANISDNLVIAGYVDGKSLLAAFEQAESDYEKAWDEYHTKSNEIWKKHEKARSDAYDQYEKDGDRAALDAAMEEADKEYELAMGELDWRSIDKAYCQARSEAFNKYTNSALADKNENYKIAKLGMSVVEFDGYSEEIYVLHFNDETSVDANVFFGQGFDKLIKSWENLLTPFK